MRPSDAQVERWLREDLGHRDVSNHLPGETTGRLVARESGVLAGVDAAAAVFGHLDVEVTRRGTAGDRVAADETVLAVRGPTRAVLRGERVAANLVGHASGVASETARAVAAVREVADDVAVAATRKTTPGLRGVEKRAVAAGGGDTHRLDAAGAVMVKDNHVAELGLVPAIERLRERKSFLTRLEVEVESAADARRAATAGADAVLFDNLSPRTVAAGVDAVPDEVLTEASGGIDHGTVADYAATGVDAVSMGSLTHSAPSLDVSFRTG